MLADRNRGPRRLLLGTVVGVIAALAAGSLWASNRAFAMFDDIDWLNQ